MPICAKSADEAVDRGQCFLLTEAQQPYKAKGCSKFLFPNKGAMGYYRYDYDASAFEANGSSVVTVSGRRRGLAVGGSQCGAQRGFEVDALGRQWLGIAE